MGNQVSSAPTPSHDYQEGRYGGAAVAAAAAANMENHGAPQKLQRPNFHKSVISSDEAVRIYGGICVTEIYGTNSNRTSKPNPVINGRYY
ncbi:hypothetical protein Pyn_35938 [Prunus yedoensis var. nudiflora]|uniref:Uncharacterized protein n=1 Tax=Prunus yedoensis var. nudiflora TaxID=2094558 RepID=A0A314YP12_PRUYE|nr:hypothetical protein Pyn_35938 [Prunus yedoensis var. nudiflora]